MDVIKILGIDPSVRGTGLGVIEKDGYRLKYINSTTLKFKASYTYADCLNRIFKGVGSFLEEYMPGIAVIEEPPFVKSVSVLRKLGGVEAVAITAISSHNIPIFALSPTQIKKSTTGYGKAEKECVQKWVRGILNLNFIPDPDSADALAAAITLANKQNQLIPIQLYRL